MAEDREKETQVAGLSPEELEDERELYTEESLTEEEETSIARLEELTREESKAGADEEEEEEEEGGEQPEEVAESDEAEMLDRIDEEIASMLRSSTSLRDFISEKYGLDLSKYTSDLQLLQGLVHATKLLGERAEKVKLYEYLESRYGPEKMRALLEGRMTIAEFDEAIGEAIATQQAAKKEKFDLSLLEQVEYDPSTGQLRPKPGAPPNVTQEVIKFLERRERLLNEFAVDPEGFLAKYTDQILAQRSKQAQEQYQHYSVQQAKLQEAQQRVHKWISERSQVLFVQGDPEAGFTNFGRQFYAELERISRIAKEGTDPVELLETAFRLAKDAYQGARPPQAARRTQEETQKGRTPAAPAPRRKTQEELILEGLSLAEAALKGV